VSEPAGEPGHPGTPRPGASRALLVYTAGRIVAFLIGLGVLRLLGFRSYALFVGALLLSAVLSLLLLRRQRAAVSEALAARPKRDASGRAPLSRRAARADPPDDHDGYDPYADDEDDVVDPFASDPGDAPDRTAPPRR